MRHLAQRGLWAAILFSTAFFPACNRGAAPLVAGDAPVEVYDAEGYGIEVQRPQLYDDPQQFSYIGLGRLDNVDRLPEASRYTPPFIALPQDWQAFELVYVPEKGKKCAFYTYFSFVPGEEATLDEVQQELSSKLERAFKVASPAWETQKPGDSGIAWRHVSVEAEMLFDTRFLELSYNPTTPLEKLPARLDFYIAALEQPLANGEGTRPFTAIIGWRAPTEHMERFDFFAAAQAAMATVKPLPEGERRELPPVLEETMPGSETEDSAEQAPPAAAGDPGT